MCVHVHVCVRRHLKGELFAAKDEMLQEKDELFRTQLELSQLRHAAADAANQLVLLAFDILGMFNDVNVVLCSWLEANSKIICQMFLSEF